MELILSTLLKAILMWCVKEWEDMFLFFTPASQPVSLYILKGERMRAEVKQSVDYSISQITKY